MTIYDERNWEEQHSRVNKPFRSLLFFGVILGLIILISLSLGRYQVSIINVFRILINEIVPLQETWSSEMASVVLNIRVPRILLAVLVGSCLSVAGVSYQGVFQNPMASPDLLGATSGAAFGAALAILLGGSSMMISMSAFIFSLLTVLIVYFIGKKASGNSVMNLILSGIMIGSLFTAGTSLIKLVADPTNQLPSITYWLMGSLSGAKNKEVVFVALPMLLGLTPLILMRYKINILTLGDDVSKSLGINPDHMRLIVIVASTMITAASVSISGMIGWVGLVIPHLTRKIIGNNYQYLIPGNLIIGGGFMLIVDNISRNLLSVEIPIGILTAFIGAPFFAYLILRKEGAIHD
ncbi:MAG: iron ABC transporter permease [Clostridia bacterium]|nr:iron ABC transporter permease [Clostridia bacterium]